MPRPNKARTVQAERDLAQRVAWERDRRGWTNEGLAQRMTNAGCAIRPSAIYKIEKGDPPRRVTVNELVAMAMVFGLPVTDLLQPPGSLVDVEITKAVFGVADAIRAFNAAVGAVEKLVADDPQRRIALRLLLQDFKNWPEVIDALKFARSGKGKQFQHEPQPYDDSRGVLALTDAGGAVVGTWPPTSSHVVETIASTIEEEG